MFPTNPNITMAQADRIIAVMRDYGGIVTLGRAIELGMSRKALSDFVARNWHMIASDAEAA